MSTTLAPELGTAQTWADFIAGLLYGSELPRLTAYIAPFAEMQSICGDNALGCYGANRMVSMGETNYGVSAEEVVDTSTAITSLSIASTRHGWRWRGGRRTGRLRAACAVGPRRAARYLGTRATTTG